ncbi:MAG: plasmid pRiA4b ORF-3 family protein [Sphingomonadales bacterium]|jgi:hypothetical protein|nr:MAG: plasmid pRiA4b ORF-3 family protein [Alphaproteobacteria bacterium]TNF05321.1 MAG: plasmid pRiA4b ORF-3 family protein [Sphingomonadales bacterium]
MFGPPDAVQLRLSIDEIKPVAWRRLIVPSGWNLEQLHLVIQGAFNWWNYHLHEFDIGGLRYSNAAESIDGSTIGDPKVFDEREVRLRDFRNAGTSFTYLYDFGDNWYHTIEIEDYLFLESTPHQATCIDGAGARPPEDVGGVPGYERFLDVIRNPKDPEYRETKRWCGGHFDPGWFDLATVDRDVRNALKPGVRRKLHQPRPKKSQS